MAYVVLACRMALSGVFLLAVVSKLRSRAAYAQFVSYTAALRLIPSGWVRTAAAGAVAAELAAAVLLALPATGTAGFAVAAVALAAFTAALGTALRRGLRAPCRCFGASPTSVGAAHLIRNLSLLLGCAIGGAGALIAPPATLDLGGVGVAICVAIVVVLIVHHLDTIVDVLTPETR